MLKERLGAKQLADMIARKINVAGVEIAVRKDHAFGRTRPFCWPRPTQSDSKDGQKNSLEI